MAFLLSLSFQGFGSVTVKASSPIETLYFGLNFPVAFAFAPGGRIFYNEKDTGNIRVIQSGSVLPIPFANVGPLPGVGGTEEGLLGIALDPNFFSNHYVYVYWTYFNATYKQVKITRWTDTGNTGGSRLDIFNFTDPNPLNRQPQVGGPTNHNGGYMKFGPDGKLYFEVGDFCSWDCLSTPLAQHLDTYAGKILRMNPDGTVPSDNPKIGDTQHRLIWAYGYRNGFGMDFSPSGKLIATMAGPDCCDRIFFVSNSSNFGWPNCGVDSKPACLAPYTPSIYQTGPTVTPTGIAYSSNPNILYFGEDNTGSLMQLVLTPSGTLAQLHTIASGFGAILAVERGPDGKIWFSTPNTIYRFTPSPVTLTVSPASPANGTLLDSTLATFQVRAVSSGVNVPEVNVTIYVNGTKICDGLSNGQGLVGCDYQVVHQGKYYWNATAKSNPPIPVVFGFFTVGLVAQVQLVGGWNLISLPIVPASTQLSKILAGQIATNDFTVVWSYQNSKWLSAMLSNGKLSGPLTTMQDGLGYWVYMAHPDTLYVTGSVIPPAASPPTYSLPAGWNLIGFKPQPDPTSSETVIAYLTSISGNYDVDNVWVYNGSWVRATGSTSLTPGEGMWVLMTSPATLKP